MKDIMRGIRRFLQSEEGPTSVEYAVMLAFIITVCVASIQMIGTNLSARFNEASNLLT